MKRRWVHLVLAGFAVAGDWVSTSDDQRVCRLTTSIVRGMTLQSSFCEDWQPGFPRVYNGQQFPFWQDWIRRSAPWPVGYIQIHVEGKGWIP